MHVDLFHYLDKKNVILGVKGKNKRTILSTLLDCLISAGKIDKIHKKEILKALVQREEMGSTAIGGSIALPHVRLDCIKKLIIGVAVSYEGVDFDSLDEEPVCILVMLLSNKKEAGLHLKMLALLARVLKDKYFIEQLKSAKTEEEIMSFIQRQVSILK